MVLVGRLSGGGLARFVPGWLVLLPPAAPRSRGLARGWHGCPSLWAWGSPLFGSLPLLLFPFLPVWFPPLAAVFRLGYLGFLFLRLARLLVAPGRPLTFPRLVCFFPFVRHIISYFTDNYQLNVIKYLWNSN